MPETDRLLGELNASVKAVNDNVIALRSEQTVYADQNRKEHVSIVAAASEQSSTIVGLTVQMSSHIKHDDSRFSLIWRVLFGAGAAVAIVYGAVRAVAG